MPRPTDDRKGETIRLRVNEEMRLYLERQASKTAQSVSEYVRQLIRKDMMTKKK